MPTFKFVERNLSWQRASKKREVFPKETKKTIMLDDWTFQKEISTHHPMRNSDRRKFKKEKSFFTIQKFLHLSSAWRLEQERRKRDFEMKIIISFIRERKNVGEEDFNVLKIIFLIWNFTRSLKSLHWIIVKEARKI